MLNNFKPFGKTNAHIPNFLTLQLYLYKIKDRPILLQPTQEVSSAGIGAAFNRYVRVFGGLLPTLRGVAKMDAFLPDFLEIAPIQKYEVNMVHVIYIFNALLKHNEINPPSQY